MALHLQGLRSIGPHVVGPFCEIVKLRNRLAKLCGAEDFYDYTVKQAEGFSKRCAASGSARSQPACAAGGKFAGSKFASRMSDGQACAQY